MFKCVCECINEKEQDKKGSTMRGGNASAS